MPEQPMTDRSVVDHEPKAPRARRAYEAPHAEFVPLDVTERLMGGCGVVFPTQGTACSSNPLLS